MRSKLKAICLIAALLAALGASAAAASPLLSADDMSTLRGGCSGGGTFRCNTEYCGPSGGTEGCKEGDHKTCNPDDPEVACDNQLREGKNVWGCGNVLPTGDRCRQGKVEICGRQGNCYCNALGLCKVEETGTWGRYPCLDP